MNKLFPILIALLLICSCEKKADPFEAELINSYGAIRADIARTACKIVGYDNDSILNLIKNNSLDSLKHGIAKNDTLYAVISAAKPLKGTQILVYHKNLRDTRRDFQYKLATFYPKREAEIEKSFHVYLKSIDQLTTKLLKKKEQENIQKRMAQVKTETSADSNPRLRTEHIVSIIVALIALVAVWNRKPIAKMFSKKTKRQKTAIPITSPEDNKDVPQKEKNAQSADTNKEPEALTNECNNEPTEVTNDKQIVSEDTYSRSLDTKGKMTASDAGEWIVVGASVQGNSHVDMKLPCQDNHVYEYLKEGWGIAITSDGAGSAKLSQIGSAAAVSRALFHFKELIAQEKWIEKSSLPTDNEWIKLSYKVLKTVRDELEALAQKNKLDLKDLSATIIVVIHSPVGLLTAHIGDGRAGYRDLEGQWHSLLTPHKGEEANQTIFIPSNFWNIPYYEMSGVFVPESKVVREPVSAFTLMSDGCEATSWLWNQKNESTGKFFDPNLPHDKFFNPLLETLQEFRKDKTPLDERAEKWFKFIQAGNKSFIRETDDKTMILGALYI